MTDAAVSSVILLWLATYALHSTLLLSAAWAFDFLRRDSAPGVRIALCGYAVAALFHPTAYHFYFYYLAGLAVAVRRIGAASLIAPWSAAPATNQL